MCYNPHILRLLHTDFIPPDAYVTMDPFQCRLHFTKLLSNLTASAVAAKQCAQFALKYRDVDEDLFSVILEQLQSVCKERACVCLEPSFLT
jgi:hypothetical protein